MPSVDNWHRRLQCHSLLPPLAPLLTPITGLPAPVCVGSGAVCTLAKKTTSSLTVITKGKDLWASNPSLTNHTCAYTVCAPLIYSVCVYLRAFPATACLWPRLQVCLYACAHVRGDKRALGVSRGERLWNMESSRVVLFVTPVL